MIDICHIEILCHALTFPDPDGEGEVKAYRGEIRLIRREYAESFARLDNPPVRILSDEESKERFKNVQNITLAKS